MTATSATAINSLPRQTERQFLAQLVQLARMLGWTTYHTWLSKHSTAGFPDLVLVRPPRLVFAEIKSDRGRVAPAQSDWLAMLGRCPRVETYLWRPRELDEIAARLR